jgi:Contractile injection system tube protein
MSADAKLQKAKLLYLPDGKATPDGKSDKKSSYDITFMYNPTEISLSRSMNIEQARGARDSTGANKTSFKHPNPYSLKISNIILDTYESGISVLPKVEVFKKGVEFINPKNSTSQPSQAGRNNASGTNPNQQNRPPIYLFTWGANKYLRCFMKQVAFKFTMFFPNGDPARAVLDLTLEQVSIPQENNQRGTPSPSQQRREDANRALFT